MKLSDTNSASLSFYTFYLDRALESDLVLATLKSVGASVERHKDYFADDARDVDWLPVIGGRGWVILSKDQFNLLERRAIINARARAFLQSRGELRGEEMAAIVVKALPEMLRILDLTTPPFIAKIYRDGSVSPPAKK